MKYNFKTIRKIKENCNNCKNTFSVWLSAMNFEQEKEEGIKNHLYNHCPSCKVLNKIKNK